MSARRCLGALALLAAGVAAAQAQPAGAPTTMPVARPARHALIIGIGEYAEPAVPELRGVRHDVASARRMAAAMAIPEANVTTLRDGAATAERIRAELSALDRRVRDGDRVFVYYSGHGTRWSDEQQPGGGCVEGLLAADGVALTNAELGSRLAPLARRADKMLVFYDACFSGGVAGAPSRLRGMRAGDELITPKFSRTGSSDVCASPSNYRTRSLALVLQEQRAVPQNVVYVAASRPDELSFDSSTQGGFATSAWRDCLLGEARDLDGSGAITVDEVTRCAQGKITSALAGQPGILGQQMTLAGNAQFVPAWMGAAFDGPAAPGSAQAVVASLTAGAALAPAPAAPAPARATPAEVLAEVHSQRDGARRVVATLRRQTLRIGIDTLEIDVTPTRDGYLYVAQAGSDGQSLYLLYPNALAADNRVRAGERVALPGKGWEVVAGGPPGTETLLVMVSDAPRDLSALGQEKAGPFMKTLLDAQGRARLQWVLSNGRPGEACPRAGAAGCSDAFGAALLKLETIR